MCALTVRGLTGLLVSVLLGTGLVACGGKLPQPIDDGRGLQVGIFVDNAFGDGDFFDQAAKAIDPVETDLDATVNTYEGQLQAQNFEPMLQDAADANDIVFVLGFEAIDALVKVAEDNPDTTFVFVDGVVDSPHVVSAEFRTAEGCFMAGALAATVNERASEGAAGFVGGVNAPVVQNCRSGFEQGVRRLAPGQAVAAQFVGSFVDPAKGREVALSLADKGAYAMFAYAGLSGAGMFDAAKSGDQVAPIGIVNDKSHLAPGKTPGSLEMGVDTAIIQLTKSYSAGDLEPGTRQSFGFAEGGWDMIYDRSLVRTQDQEVLRELEQRITDGKLAIHE